MDGYYELLSELETMLPGKDNVWPWNHYWDSLLSRLLCSFDNEIVPNWNKMAWFCEI